MIHQLMREKGLQKAQVACMDELFLHLTPTSVKEQRSCTAGLQKQAGFPGATATVFLCTTADGKLLPPLLVIKVQHL